MTGVSRTVLAARTTKPIQLDKMLRVIVLGMFRVISFVGCRAHRA